MDTLLRIIGVIFILWLIPILDEIRLSYKHIPDYKLGWRDLWVNIKYSFILFYNNYWGFYVLNPKWFIKNQVFRSKHKNLFKKPENYIPMKTDYCRDCPFAARERNWRFMQMNGYCHLYRIKDWWGNGFSLLWDGIKECGVNVDITFDEE